MKISKGDSFERHPNETLEVQPAKIQTIACIQWIIWRDFLNSLRSQETPLGSSTSVKHPREDNSPGKAVNE
jgi:hypothetical protein